MRGRGLTLGPPYFPDYHMTTTKRPKGAFDDAWAGYKVPSVTGPVRAGTEPLDKSVADNWTPSKPKPAKLKGKRNPSIAERIRKDGGLGMSDETKRWLGTDAKGPLGTFNRAFASLADIPVAALQIAGHATDWAAQGADNAWEGSAADKATAKVMGVHMRPSELIGGLPEAFPIDGAFGAPHPQASATGRFAASKSKGVLAAVLKDEKGAVPIKARHYSFAPDLTETDPAKWGSNRTPGFLPREERARKGTAPNRTWFGLQSGEGVTKPYSKERGVGPYAYDAEIDKDRFFDANGDKSWLTEKIAALPRNESGRILYAGKAYDGAGVTEQLIKDAGYSGYTITDSMLGDVAAAFEPVPVTRVEKPLPGAPVSTTIDGQPVRFGPYDPFRNLAQDYTSMQGLNYTPPTRYANADPDFHSAVADAFEDMKHDPTDPDVAEAYGALKNETAAQLKALQDQGYEFSFMDPKNDPYPNPWQAIQDLRDNKRMQVYPTNEGFGSGDSVPTDNPLLEVIPGQKWKGKSVTYNDAFRAVHDALGHAKEGVGFRAGGENHAYLQHLPTFSPAAQRALATETLGQNSWLNYGPHGALNRKASVSDTIFADQKNGLLPDDLIYGGQAAEFMPDPRSTSYGRREEVRKGGALGMARVRDMEGLKALMAERAPKSPVARVFEALGQHSVGRRMALDDIMRQDFPEFQGPGYSKADKEAFRARLEQEPSFLEAALRAYVPEEDPKTLSQ